jgi:hypothetical protein
VPFYLFDLLVAVADYSQTTWQFARMKVVVVVGHFKASFEKSFACSSFGTGFLYLLRSLTASCVSQINFDACSVCVFDAKLNNLILHKLTVFCCWHGKQSNVLFIAFQEQTFLLETHLSFDLHGCMSIALSLMDLR